MFVQPTNTKRFNLYHMDESEIYIQDFYGYCTYFDLTANEERVKDKGITNMKIRKILHLLKNPSLRIR